MPRCQMPIISKNQEAAATVQLHSQYQGLIPCAAGGLGQVYQTTDHDLHRPVALKVLHEKWCSSEQACHDFLQEAQITSQLDHPGIVPIYQVGTTPDGRPCYSMRLIHGQTLRQAIEDYHNLPAEQKSERRLAKRRLINHLASVSRTIAYAHSKGVLHRDIKPENIMLGEFGEAIILDWGLAKSSNSEQILVDDTYIDEQATEYSTQVRGTLAYLSPEQAHGEKTKITPASDIFALGATLYTILCNRPPYQELTKQDNLEHALQARFEKPSSYKPAPKALEAICLKAMSKEPGQRYATALDFADDLDRYLADEPVSAWVEPWTDQARRTILRYKTAFASLLLLAIIIPTALAIGSWLLIQERTKALLSEQKAKLQEEAARQITEYLTRLFQAADPVAGSMTGFRTSDELSHLQTAIIFLERGQELIGQHLKDQPLARARLLLAMSRTYHSLGTYEQALSLAKECNSLLQKHLGEDDTETVSSLQLLGLIAQDTGDYQLARTYFENVLAKRKKRWGNEHLLVAESLFSLGNITFYQPLSDEGTQFIAARRQQAETYLLEALRIRKKLHTSPHPEIGYTLASLASLKLSEPGQDIKALGYANEAMKHFQKSGDGSIGNFIIKMIQADQLRQARKFAEAEKIYIEVLASMKKHLGSKHPFTVLQMANHVGLVNASQDMDRALRMAKELLEVIRTMPYFRSQPMIVERMIYFSDVELNRGAKEAGLSGYREAMTFARERPAANARNLTQLTQRFRDHGLAMP